MVTSRAGEAMEQLAQRRTLALDKPDETIWLHTSALSTVCHFSGGESPNTRCATRSIRYPERRPDEDLLAQVVDRHLGPGGEAVVGWHDRHGPAQTLFDQLRVQAEQRSSRV